MICLCSHNSSAWTHLPLNTITMWNNISRIPHRFAELHARLRGLANKLFSSMYHKIHLTTAHPLTPLIGFFQELARLHGLANKLSLMDTHQSSFS